MSEKYLKEQATAVDIAQKAGVIMLEYFYGGQQEQLKRDGSQVTIADTTINSMVIKELAKSFPDDGVIGEEESTAEYGHGRKWFCDPIDGTRAYTWASPTAMFSLGLVVDGVPVMGVVYDPFLGDMFTGIKGQGSFRNSIPLKVSASPLQNNWVATTANSGKIIRDRDMFSRLSETDARTAAYSGAVHKASRVAMSNFVAYLEPDVNAHDMAAIQVIVEEAGGRVTDMAGNIYDYTKPFKGTLVSNGLVHNEMLGVIKGAGQSVVEPSRSISS